MNADLISAKALEQIILHQKNEREQEIKDDISFAEKNNTKELEPFFELTSVVFDPNTRATKLEFLQTSIYRTIIKYITRDYVKYPVYSELKTKTKTIKKSIKLTNHELEKLNINSEFLLSDFAHEIIFRLNAPQLYPSWFISDMLEKQYLLTMHLLSSKSLNFEKSQNAQRELSEISLNGANQLLKKQEKKLNKISKKYQKIEIKIEKLATSKFTPFYAILSFGYISKSRLNRLNNKKEKVNTNLISQENIVNSTNNKIKTITQEIENIKKSIKEDKKQTKSKMILAKNVMDEKLPKVQQLGCEVIVQNSNFIPLKVYIGYEYKKIIGCYIIHNIEKDKYYVGQSKDIIRRLKQHFKGTIPNNIIFAEDYYSSKINKEDIFEIKIIPCKTKDELDRTEKNLIEKYDAWNSGYNGTSGNK